MRIFLLIFLMFLIGLGQSDLSAQKGVEFGGHIGVAHYFGDLNPDFIVSDPGFSFGVKFRRNFNERLSISGGVDYGRISGSDSDSNNGFEQSRNLSFRSDVLDFNFAFEFNFFPYVHGSDDEYYTPYLFTGFSFMSFNPMADYEGVTYELRDFMTEDVDYGLLTPTWFYGIGLKWDYNRDWSFNVNLSGRNAVTDYLDDVSQNYPSYSGRDAIFTGLANPSSVEGFGQTDTQRGNAGSNDKVFFLSVGAMRYIGRIHCPPITKGQY